MMIEIKDLVKDYSFFRALDRVSLSIEGNAIVGLLGPNGAGKTTLMRILTGFIPYTYGEVAVDGFDLFTEPQEVKRRIGYLPETCPLYVEMTVKDFLVSMARLRGVSKRVVGDRLDYVVEAVQIKQRLNQVIGTLSKGYKQRVGLAQSLIHDPKILILDEPTVGLDPVQIIEIRELIQRLKQDRTIILSTHILSEVSQTCERIVVISEGRILAQGTEAELIQQLSEESLVHVEVDGEHQKALRIIQGLSGVQSVRLNAKKQIEVQFKLNHDARKEIARHLVHEGIGVLELAQKHVTLEELFIRLTQGDSVVKATQPNSLCKV